MGQTEQSFREKEIQIRTAWKSSKKENIQLWTSVA
jgi:hypothetical protein